MLSRFPRRTSSWRSRQRRSLSLNSSNFAMSGSGTMKLRRDQPTRTREEIDNGYDAPHGLRRVFRRARGVRTHPAGGMCGGRHRKSVNRIGSCGPGRQPKDEADSAWWGELRSLSLIMAGTSREIHGWRYPSESVKARQMPDIVDRATRSRMMAGIVSRDTVPELLLRRALHARGIRNRLHDRSLLGTPDLVFRRFRAVCFIHGCFWHRHADCRYATTPATRAEFWQAKFRANVERDGRNRLELLEEGWRVAFVWECALRRRGQVETASNLEKWLRGEEATFETKRPDDG